MLQFNTFLKYVGVVLQSREFFGSRPECKQRDHNSRMVAIGKPRFYFTLFHIAACNCHAACFVIGSDDNECFAVFSSKINCFAK